MVEGKKTGYYNIGVRKRRYSKILLLHIEELVDLTS